MTAVLSPWIQDVMDLWPLWAAIGSLLGAWIVWSLRTWLKVNVADPLAQLNHRADQLQTEVTAIVQLVSHHLGANGNSPRMHDRLHAVEKALDIDSAPPPPYPRAWPDHEENT